jgi:predicted permease
VNGLLLGSLPVRDVDRLVCFQGARTFSWPDYVDYRDGTKDIFQGISADFPAVTASISGHGEPERVWGQMTTANYFDVIGVNMTLGRGFLPEEDQAPGRNPVVVLSHGLWTRRFGADPAIVGKEVRFNGYSYRVVGVAQKGYVGAERILVGEFWVPLSMRKQIAPDMDRDRLIERRTAQWLVLNARLKPGVSNEQATAAVNVIKARIDEQHRKGRKHDRLQLTRAGQMFDGLGNAAMGLSAVLMTVVALVLLIACANVANILLARATARQKEIGIRLAVGASRARLLRQLLTESVLLSLMGAVIGFVAATWAARAISAFQVPLPIPITFDFTPDLRVFAFTAALAVVTGILFGFAPAIRATRPDLVNALKDTVAPLGSHRRWGLRNTLVVLQVSLSLVLLIGSGLFLRSLQNAASIDIGMKPDGITLLAFDPKLSHYTPERAKLLISQLRDRLTAEPGVEAVTFIDSLPLSIGGTSFDFKTTAGKGLNADVYNVGESYFRTVGVPLVRGREFDIRSDAGVPAAIINETMASNAFGTENPIGRELEAEKQRYRIIGIARNAKSRTLGEGPVNMAYLFLEASPETIRSFYGISVVVKSVAPPAAMDRAIREQLRQIDPNLPVFNGTTLREHANKALLLPQVCASLLGVFGCTGLLLSMVGLYGVMSFAVRSRTKEIGIRVALGAGQTGVLAMITRQGLALAGVGLVIGLAIAAAVSRFTESFLYGVSTTDVATFVAVPLLLLGIAAVAVFIPARRAARVDPMTALRYE